MDKHGGAIDPFALSFEGPDGVPTQARHNTPSETSMHSTQASPSTPSRSANQRYSVQEEIPVGPPQSKTSTRYRNPDPTYQEHIGAPTHPPQPAQPIPSAPARVENQTYGAQSGAPIASARPAPPTPYRSLEQIPWEPVYPRQSPVSTPAGSVNSISRVPVGTRTSYLPKVQAAVSVAEVRSPAATHTGYEPVSKVSAAKKVAGYFRRIIN
ncbi:hypothetical protein NA56DRAFT_38732 [Hyaloscypha hepaticicola]|uniref:Uncharacterized protein n=1 Tax=Hyaloscypha hepaticicola TaxID=2082293 RepID=A0A2J6PDN1_9HELO|nr:hypothetical protein NA56DRAFT_38732 [Hyaloscypha hepaticicola]